MASGSVHQDVFRMVKRGSIRELGAERTEEIFAGVDLDHRIPIDVAMQTWANLWDADEDGTLGARLGRAAFLGATLGGAFFDACGAESTVARGLRVLARYYSIVSTAAEIEVELKHADTVPELWVRLVYGAGQRLPIVGQTTLQTIRTALESVTQRRIQPIRVHVAAPVDRAIESKLSELFEGPVTSGAGFDALVFDGALAQFPLHYEVSERAKELADAALTALSHVDVGTPFQEQVVKEIQAILPEAPTLERVAAAFEMGGRTFQKRLTKEGETFREICLRSRLEIARGYLSIGGGVSEVAFLVGYTDPTTFSRAYRKHFGHPPRDTAAAPKRR